MKKFSYIVIFVLMMLASCTDNAVLTDTTSKSKGSAIEFEYVLPTNSTRTLISSKADFPVGTALAVEGFQTTEKGELYHLFVDDKVKFLGDGHWTYDVVRYWDIASTYVFYAMYPYDVAHSFDAESRLYSIPNFVVADAKTDQKDVMISEEKSAMPENVVTFNMNHILSQVNFFFKAASGFNTSGIESIELTSFDLVGAKNKGSYTQTGYNQSNQNVTGAWNVASEGEYDMPEITSAALVTGENPVSTIESGLLLMPQDLKGVKAQVSYRINYVGGATASYSAEVAMVKAFITKKKTDDGEKSNYVTAWRPNYVYNYTFGVNPTTRGIDDYDVDIDGSTDGDGTVTPDVVIVVDPNGDWWIDEDGDGVGDIPIVWEDIDGDGKEEGGVDRDGDGHIDNVDGENDNPDNNPLVTDGNENNPNGGDAIIVDTDGDGVGDTQLERDGDKYYPDPERSMNIEFSADVEGFENEIDAYAE